VAPPTAAKLNRPGFTARNVNVPVPGTPVQGPDLPVPDGLNLVVKAGSRNTSTVFVGGTSADAAVAGTRASLGAGAILLMRIQNANQVWCDALNATDIVEFVVET